MASSSTRQYKTGDNRKKAIVVAKNDIEYYGLESIVESAGYKVSRVNFDTDKILARLLIILVDGINQDLVEILKTRNKNRIPVPAILVLKNKKDFKRLNIKILKIESAIFANDDKEIFLDAIRSVEKSSFYVSDSLLEEEQESPIGKLTMRQYEIAVLTSMGKTFDEVAEALNISVKTVRNQASLINKVLGEKSYYQAIVKYF
ncbi:MAG: LuxR C-terminal-related transcriptional regulator [Ezakiella sp.]|nr:LuxR C-terminal-related transcriptional regulator [Ezakiella sp.]MDD7761171.1 LuxR C-terminal-related transcriptional regulator [Bacillota bacterium]MDY3947330.1 LuxR C-terminal-related transcriptional regulator [Ezakiella sp.]